jgi:tetratricopeptide (TPR) repeat protein
MQAANRDFAGAVASNPRLPYADLEWGRLLLLQHDVVAAEAHLRRAADLAPHFADPLKYLGDAQFASKRFDAAAASYARAAELAPRWGANQLMWGKALWEDGKRDEARRKFASARAMDLSASDRSWLDRIARS